MKKTLKALSLALCATVLATVAAIPASAAEPVISWKADVSDLSKLESESREDPTKFVTMDGAAGEVFMNVEANGDLGGIKAKIVDNDDTAWKTVCFKVTVDLDKTSWFHIRHEAAPVSFCVKVTDQERPNEGVDTALFPETTATDELAIDIKEKTGWSGEKTFWVKYFMIDGNKSGGQNIADVMCISDSMAYVGAAKETEAPTTEATEEGSATTADKTTTTTKAGTTTTAAGDKDEGGSNVMPIVIGVVVAVVVIGAIVAVVVVKKKKGAAK